MILAVIVDFEIRVAVALRAMQPRGVAFFQAGAAVGCGGGIFGDMSAMDSL